MTETFEMGQKAPRMLIADDDPAVLALLADRCLKMGFEIETATNGIQLLIKARQTRPDILIVDVNMPELDGLSVCTRLLEPGGKPIEVVVVTGSSDQDTIARCQSLGMHYGRKGPGFWKNIESALVAIYPGMASRIEGRSVTSTGPVVPERPRVLLIDDDPAMELFMSSRLSKYGVDTLYASGAVHGFRIACREKPSAIVCDYSMPNGDALYLLSRLRTTPATMNIPVIVVSGRQLDDVTQQRLKQDILGRPGAVQVLSKSFDTDELFTTLQQFCAFNKK